MQVFAYNKAINFAPIGAGQPTLRLPVMAALAMLEQLTIRKACSANASRISELICKVVHGFNSGASGEVAPWFIASVTPSSIAGHIADTKPEAL